MLSTPTISGSAELERSAGVEMNFNSALHAIIIFLITTSGGYLELQYQSQKKSPLEEHKKIMVAVYVNLFMYGICLMAEFKLKSQRTRGLLIIKRLTPLFGILVVVLIMIILYPMLGFVALILWALLTMDATIKLCEEFFQWFWPMFLHAREIVTSYFNWAENHSPGIQENGLAIMETNGFLKENELPV